jgi:hypothetical protein
MAGAQGIVSAALEIKYLILTGFFMVADSNCLALDIYTSKRREHLGLSVVPPYMLVHSGGKIR